MAEVVLVLVAGVAAGVLAGLFGIGGGVLFVPVLVLAFGFEQVVAEGTSLVAIVPVVLVGAWRQHRAGLVDWRVAIPVGALSVGGSVLGALAAEHLPERALRLGFALFLCWTASRFLARWRGARPAPSGSPTTP